MKPKASVFVVDDEEPIRHAFEILLQTQGVAAKPFASAEEFLEAYSDDWSGCAFFDVRLPNMSGIELYRLLRARNTSLTMVLMTGHESVQSVHGLVNAEVVILEKPFSASQVRAIIENCVTTIDGIEARIFNNLETH
jgi:FixJ family two-component response regulator